MLPLTQSDQVFGHPVCSWLSKAECNLLNSTVCELLYLFNSQCGRGLGMLVRECEAILDSSAVRGDGGGDSRENTWRGHLLVALGSSQMISTSVSTLSSYRLVVLPAAQSTA